MSLEHTIEQLRHLKLTGMVTGLEHQQSQSSYGALGFDQRLGHLVGAEVSQRESQRFKRLIANARLKVFAEPEAIDYHSGRGLDRAMAADLLTCGWIERQQNVLITGHTGTGKTWLACALAVQAARNGIPIGYRRVGRLLEEMELAHADGSLPKLRGQLAKTKLLILDDFGLTPLSGRGRADLLELLDDRVGSGATIVAGQMPVKDWHAFIHDPALADAIMDRLIHSSHKLALKGDSLRKVKAPRTRE
ncbi:IS21-like element helper ATPase IstB [Stenotrophomonas maltophilia]|uniref:IS21-like element helper ATPase IstB n=1 Tax=Stenotrophomonas maltophilia TaxID=40324 RepID=UPI00244BEAB5|nr:IS21-like element helper ATPase IstB [Stenotrophomonas maltophilia]MDH0074767.1 IS21-like element helper ATPase IstB [Stenotrophomonas maltophilia]MDH0104103.1 IS21-like element helper ATPase IstB [Stenotrophomonas maltophilia]MDH0334179.1 IS21-like element helper ATPase IstB [Stenotrophomonas maltophilia]MDH0632418.1 IS21-like element helper ATPase IstB [Stenotrophomonas maltophilia]MDH0642737.1 IS21-like element helper ATPase IstB [Stenotrophomonas maltophilia]